jgi:hypothetical protein
VSVAARRRRLPSSSAVKSAAFSFKSRACFLPAQPTPCCFAAGSACRAERDWHSPSGPAACVPESIGTSRRIRGVTYAVRSCAISPIFMAGDGLHHLPERETTSRLPVTSSSLGRTRHAADDRWVVERPLCWHCLPLESRAKKKLDSKLFFDTQIAPSAADAPPRDVSR